MQGMCCLGLCRNTLGSCKECTLLLAAALQVHHVLRQVLQMLHLRALRIMLRLLHYLRMQMIARSD